MSSGSGQRLRTLCLTVLPAMAVRAGDVHPPDFWLYRPTQTHPADAHPDGHERALDRTCTRLTARGLRLTVIDPVSQPLATFAPARRFDFTAMVPLQLHETLHGDAHEGVILNNM